jgi:type I restriction enzyme S subunit
MSQTSRLKLKIEDLVARGDILEIQDGNHGEKHPKSGDYVDSGIPFIMARDINHGCVDLTSCKFLPKEKADKLRIGFAKTGDVLLTHKGTVGSVAIVPEVEPYIMLTPQVTYYRVNSNKLCNRYLAYTFRAPGFQAQLQLVSAQSTRPYIGITAQRLLEVTWAPLPTQRKIAAVLSAYDDLIENNTRRIAILEEMARLLYREWFVHFRFPGYEQVTMVDSELGPIPEGWVVVKFSDIVTLLRRGIKPYEFEDEKFAYYSFPALDAECMPLLEIGKKIRSNKYQFDKDCILLSKLNPRIPRIWLPFPEGNYRAIASTEFLVLLPKKPLTRLYLFSQCWSPEFFDDFAALTLGTSTSHQRVKPKDFLNMDTVLPPQDLIVAFSSLVKPIFEVVHTLRLKNANLRRTRDLLLPRLISGEVDVSNHEWHEWANFTNGTLS